MDHTAAKIRRSEVVWDPSLQSPDCPPEGTLPRSTDNCPSPYQQLHLHQLKVPVKAKPAKPAAKRPGNRAAHPTSSSNPQPIPELPTEHVQEFKVVWECKKKFHTVPVERARAQQ